MDSDRRTTPAALTAGTTAVVTQEKALLIEVPGLPTRLFLESAETATRFSIVEHTLGAGLLGAPLHTHRDEDEFSFVVEGTLSAQLGSEIVHIGPGGLLKKPRGISHAFWNEGVTQLRFVEMISPGGFERFFVEIAKLNPNSFESPDEYMAAIAQIGETNYNVTFDFSGLEELMRNHRLSV